MTINSSTQAPNWVQLTAVNLNKRAPLNAHSFAYDPQHQFYAPTDHCICAYTYAFGTIEEML